jgi:hypothetical protein
MLRHVGGGSSGESSDEGDVYEEPDEENKQEEERNIEETSGKERCPHCDKWFVKVAIHIGKMHKDVVMQQKP